jgi:hypothetical protein
VGHQSAQGTPVAPRDRDGGGCSDHRFGFKFVLGLGCKVSHRFGHGLVLSQFMTDLMLAEFMLMFMFMFMLAEFVFVFVLSEQGIESLAGQSTKGSWQRTSHNFADYWRGYAGHAS